MGRSTCRSATDLIPCHDARVSVDFEPVTIGGRRPRFDPLVVGAVIVLVALYAISVSWSDDTGVHAATWHIELRPGPILPAG